MDLVDYSFESSVKYLSVDKNMRLPAFDGSFNFLESITPCLGYTINIKNNIEYESDYEKAYLFFRTFSHHSVLFKFNFITMFTLKKVTWNCL